MEADRAMTWSLILGLSLTASLRAQERVRTAAPALPIASYERSPDAFFYFGPFQEVLIGSVGVRYTDNVNLTATDKISDLSFFEGLSLNTTWVISHLNQIRLNVGGELDENFYGNGRSLLTFSIAPDSMVDFKFQVGDDLTVRLYDEFSYVQNPTTDPNATNTANLNSLTNSVGTVVDYDLGFALASFLGELTYNDQSGQTAEGQNNASTTGSRESLRVGPTLTFRLSPTILYGVNAVATRSSGQGFANVNSLNFGPFIKGKLTPNLEFDLAAGPTLVDTKPAIGPDYYVNANIRYLITRHWQLLLSAAHELIFTNGTNLTEQNLFKLGTQLDLTRWTTLTVSPFLNVGDVKTTTPDLVIGGVSTGPYTLFGIEAGVTWKPRKRWSTEFTYDFTRRESSTSFAASSDSYIENRFSFRINYSF
jgi:hypothetical protein